MARLVGFWTVGETCHGTFQRLSKVRKSPPKVKSTKIEQGIYSAFGKVLKGVERRSGLSPRFSTLGAAPVQQLINTRRRHLLTRLSVKTFALQHVAQFIERG